MSSFHFQFYCYFQLKFSLDFHLIVSDFNALICFINTLYREGIYDASLK
jgi:hypothetical protein